MKLRKALLWCWNKFINFWKMVWREVKDWRTLLLFLLMAVILYSPSIVCYTIGIIGKNRHMIAIATSVIMFWASPLTPATPICIAGALGLKKLFKRWKKKNGRKSNRKSK